MNSFEDQQTGPSKKKKESLDLQPQGRKDLINFARQKTEKLIQNLSEKILSNFSEKKNQLSFDELRGDILETINFIQRTKITSSFSEKVLENNLERTEEEKRAQKEKENSQKIVLSIFRHDIGNKLVALFSAVNLLELGEEAYDQEFVLGEIKRQIEQAKKLLEEVEKLEKSISSGEAILQDVKKVAEDIKEAHSDLKIEIKEEGYGQNLIKTNFSFYSILDNIVSNAIRHGQAQEMEIKIKKEGNFLLTEIENNGSKLKEGVEEKIFEKGFKNEKTGNTGLGLTLVRENIEKNSGKIWAENTEKGVKFIIKFPLLERN